MHLGDEDMRTLAATTLVIALASLMDLASADVSNMGGTRDPNTGQWTGLASLELVTVGDPGNQPDTLPHRSDDGSVGYTYQVGKYDVTTAQYCQFLNAVATKDTYALYSPNMANPASSPKGIGCGITRSGGSGSYTYSVARGYENFPVNHITWANAARFANWLANGQPTGAEGPGTTETGSYTLNGATDGMALMTVTRNPWATYAIPTANEWYKAAYYKGGSSDAGYWLYPTQSDEMPSNLLSSLGTNNANFYYCGLTDPVYYLTPVGAFAHSPGPYGTYDMGGNVSQWGEAGYYSMGYPYRELRGGAYVTDYSGLPAWSSFANDPAYEGSYTGLRLVLVPEPATLSLLTLGGLLIARRRRG